LNLKIIISPFAFLIALASSSFAFGQAPQSDELPAVFLIGEYEESYRIMADESETMLLTVCNDSMQYAFANWIQLLSDMEGMAEEIDFDLKGIKIWINLFWNPDGTIHHIVYYPKPNSKNMEYEELSAFFSYFIRNYEGRIDYTSPFSHYGSASFPTLTRRTATQLVKKG
jgi:hypothetical protein